MIFFHVFKLQKNGCVCRNARFKDYVFKIIKKDFANDELVSTWRVIVGDFGILGFGREGFEIWYLWLSVMYVQIINNFIEFKFFFIFPEPSQISIGNTFCGPLLGPWLWVMIHINKFNLAFMLESLCSDPRQLPTLYAAAFTWHGYFLVLSIVLRWLSIQDYESSK